MNTRTEPLIAVWSGPFLSRLGASKLRSMLAELRKAFGKVYRFGILAYFAVSGVQAVSIPYFPDWLSYMGHHAVYALAWPIVVPIEIDSERRVEYGLR
jgi:hypothetical protein